MVNASRWSALRLKARFRHRSPQKPLRFRPCGLMILPPHSLQGGYWEPGVRVLTTVLSPCDPLISLGSKSAECFMARFASRSNRLRVLMA